jgi:hypothetical protein
MGARRIDQLCAKVAKHSRSKGVVLLLVDKEDQWVCSSQVEPKVGQDLPNFLRIMADMIERNNEERGELHDPSLN